ncbi:hypothetical protein M2139_001858 [Enterococcus sp. PF1-24]|uniref:DUF4809 family protein n=1 Tax=unclassified Enterococcus TaxID=2608891 RepID=UPI002473E1D9|nr:MULTISPECIES: DUF4809 family protein [unclassified Enterococcus]MDH6364818.1 hypothetical protein [Enterococcus sp. PFB1-1]MDH6401958.1 hypothetical protein [Enterococcus sp. PF1-24]
MEKVLISTTVDLTEGGCNSCGISKCTVYTLHFADYQLLIDEMTVAAFVQGIALKHGWRQEMEMDLLGGDYLIFQKDGAEVTVKEEFQGTTYEKNGQKIVVPPQILSEAEVFAFTNQILPAMFDIAAVEFEM